MVHCAAAVIWDCNCVYDLINLDFARLAFNSVFITGIDKESTFKRWQ